MSEASNQVKIVEVGPRDGLQNEKMQMSVEDRVSFVERLAQAGVKYMEAGSFVSPKAIPQMADSEKVWEACAHLSTDLSFLVANQKGLERALLSGVKSIAVFSATSDSFTQKNIGRSIEDSLTEFKDIVENAKKSGLRVRGYVSTVFGCPYEGFQDPQKAIEVTDQLFAMGCEEVSIGDTIGVAHPRQVLNIFDQLIKRFGADRLAAHMHDTRGAALLNIKTALDLGIRTFDSSVGGLGGCPYAPGSSGNVATEEVVWFLEGMGYSTGIQLDRLLSVSEWIESKLQRPLRSKFYLARGRQFYFDQV